MTDRSPHGEDDRGFVCPSGCIGPEACINAIHIRALDATVRKLDGVLANEAHLKAVRVTQGNLGSIAVRSQTINAQHGALYGGCELYRLQADGLITEAISVDDMPPID